MRDHNTPDLFGDAPDAFARRTDPVTSHDAAKAAQRTSKALSDQCLTLIRKAGERGHTASELAKIIRVPRDSISPRLKPMVVKSLIRDSGVTRKPKGGREQIVWVAVDV